MRSVRSAVAAALIGLGLIASPAQAEQKTFTGTLSADQETSPGPQGGTGKAVIRIDQTKNELCYDLSWSKEVSEPNAAHIHRGPAGTNGPIVVIMDHARPTGTCLPANAVVLQGIVDDPGNHYVNIHNNEYLNGAVRGQLQVTTG